MVDYSKFDKIVDCDDDIPNVKDETNVGTAMANGPVVIGCKNCFKSCGKPLMCGKCKAVTYCSAACQKEDWQFHKRNCNKPIPMEEALQQKFSGAAFFGGSRNSDREDKELHNGVSNDKLDDEALLQEYDEQIDEQFEDEQAAIAEVVEKMVPAVWKSTTTATIALEQLDVTETVDAPIELIIATNKEEETNDVDGNAEDTQKESTIVSSEKREDADVTNKVDAPFPKCTNCLQVCPKPLTCGTCRGAIYCSSKCQKEDWQFHKRSCTKAKPKITCHCGALFKDDHMFCFTCGARRPDETTKAEPLRLNPGETEHVDDEDVGDWYRHREWKPEEKLEFPPEPLKLVETSTKSNDQYTGSAWNVAGTWDEENMLPWWKNRLASLELGVQDETFALKVDQIGDVLGKAAIVHDCGVTRFLFDLKFNVEFDVEKEETSAAGYAMQTTSSGQVQVELSDEKRENFQLKTEGPNVAVDAAEAKLLPQLRDALVHLISEYEKKA